MSEDSDDDLMLSGPVFGSGKRKREKNRAKDLAFVDAARKHETRRRKHDERMDRIKQDDNVDEEDGIKRAEQAMLTGTIDNNNYDNDDGLSRERQLALETATITGQSTLLGTRKTLLMTQHNKDLFTSVSNAVCDLKTRLCQVKDNATVGPLRKAMQKTNVLCLFLERRKMARLNRPLPREIVEWLYQAACSAGNADSVALQNLCDGAFATLSQTCPKEYPIAIEDLVPQLKRFYGLRTEKLPPCIKQEAPKKKRAPSGGGLRHFLILWTQYISSGMSSFNDDDDNALTDQVSKCLIALTRAGLDPIFHSGQRLLEPLSALMDALMRAAADTLSGERKQEWLMSCCRQILDQCQHLGPGDFDSHDNTDEKAYLSSALMVRLVAHPTDDPLSTTFLSMLCIRAVQRCVGIANWDDHIRSDTMRDKTLGCAHAALARMERDEELDGARCLACVETVIQCVLLSSSSSSSNNNESMEEQCQRVERRVRKLSAIPHFRRAEYALSCLKSYFQYTKQQQKNIQTSMDFFVST